MKMFRNLIIVGLIAVGLSSCFKEDTPIAPHPRLPVSAVIPMTENVDNKFYYYLNQVYFELSSGVQVSSNYKTDFDLSFESTGNGFLIKLNTATSMRAAQTGQYELEQVKDTVGLVWNFDQSDGNPDSTALVDWISVEGSDTAYSKEVYVINRGLNVNGIPIGLKKVIFHELKGDVFHFTCANLDDTDTKEVFITKNPGYNFTQFKFDAEDQDIQLEPATTEWDLLFTHYTTIIFTDAGEPYPYLLTGVLSNPAGTEVSLDTTMAYYDITLDDVLNLEYSQAQDKIGWDWKELTGDVTNGEPIVYVAKPNYIYLIKSQNGIYYKLRFTGFHDQETGAKGYPAFEYQRL